MTVGHVCVTTSYALNAEPRAPRHALALANAGWRVTLVDSVPEGVTTPLLPEVEQHPRITRVTHRYPWGGGRPISAALLRGRQVAQRLLLRATGRLAAGALSVRAARLANTLRSIPADIYFAHNIDALAPTATVARRNGAQLVFDCMEFYSDMGEDQSVEDASMIRRLEREYLRRCSLVTASSEEMAAAYRQEYSLPNVLALYNMAELEALPSIPKANGLALYWRNSVIGFGQRGLDDALVALSQLPDDVSLNLQGKLQLDGGEALRTRISELRIGSRVAIHDAFRTGEAVRSAAQFHVGLCLERAGNRNHELTVSSKIFDYMAAGLAVVSSNLPALAAVVARSGAGLTYAAGDTRDLVRAVLALRLHPEDVARFSAAGQRFTRSSGNARMEMTKLVNAFSAIWR